MTVLGGKRSFVGRKPLPPKRVIPITGGAFRCPACGGRSAVVDSRPRHESVRRRRWCLDCDLRFSTWEVVGSGWQPPVATIDALLETARNFVAELEKLRPPPDDDE